MFNDFLYLFKHRECPKDFKRCLIVWVKRFLNSVSVIRLLIAPFLLRIKGAKVGKLVVLGQSSIEGNYSNLMIEDEVSLGRCHITLHDRVSIGNRVVINDGVELLTASHSLSDPQWRHKKAPIVIGDYAWIATKAILLPGIIIGRGAVVGAGAVVRCNVPDYAVVAGNPAQLMDVKRSVELNYSPVLLNAPFEAWVGRNNKLLAVSSKNQ